MTESLVESMPIFLRDQLVLIFFDGRTDPPLRSLYYHVSPSTLVITFLDDERGLVYTLDFAPVECALDEFLADLHARHKSSLRRYS